MELLKAIEEQMSIGFIGKINILLGTGQIIGTIILKDTSVVHAEGFGVSGDRALDKLIFQDFDQTRCKIIVEPEAVPETIQTIAVSSNELRSRVQRIKKQLDETRKYIPPINTKIGLAKNIFDMAHFSGEDFTMLSWIFEAGQVGKLLEISTWPREEVLSKLVLFRRQKLILVKQ